MSLKLKSVNDLILLARAGGGFKVGAELKSASDLILIARAAAAGNARVIFTGTGLKSQSDLLNIANAGGGFVSFED